MHSVLNLYSSSYRCFITEIDSESRYLRTAGSGVEMMLQDQASIASLAIFGVLSIVALLFVLFCALPLTAAAIASLSRSDSIVNSALYIGNVWHTRLHPRKHAFTVSCQSYA